MIFSFCILLLACLLDRWLGEPKRWHPLVGFGALAVWVERVFNRPFRASSALKTKTMGLAGLLLLVVPVTALACWWQWQLLGSGSDAGSGREPGLGHTQLSAVLLYGLVATVVLYWTLGWRSLMLHLQAIQAAFASENIEQARDQVGRIVSRDCSAAQWPDLRRAAIESGLENTSDAIVAPLFWFLIAGVPGAVVYRLSNTLDALWGYRSERYQHFGWAAARWDDFLNLIPARLTAFAFALGAPMLRTEKGSNRAEGSIRGALHAWRTQAPHCASPNAGPVMCAGAGALGLRLGGPACYHGVVISKPWIGGEREPGPQDLVRAMKLINISLGLLIVLGLLVVLGHSLIGLGL